MNLRKIFLSAFALALIASPAAFADDYSGGDYDGKKHERKMNADTDGDGFMSKAEFLAAQEKRFSELDADNDGKVSKEEMKTHRKAKKEEMKDKKAEWEAKRAERKAAKDAAE